MTLDTYLKIKARDDTIKERYTLIKNLKQLAKEVSIQYALYYYIWENRETSLRKLYRAYCEITGRTVALNTLRKQLKILERKGLVKKIGDTYTALVEPEEVLDLFDSKRSKAGRKGALKRALKAGKTEHRISLGLAYYVKQVADEAKKLIGRGDRTAALDLLAHTLLPLRETETLWLWHRNTFIYWNGKSHNLRAVESKEVAELLKKLGYREGIMVFHTLAHDRVKKIIHRISNRGSYSWTWSRSIAYGLKELGLLRDTINYRIQIKRIDSILTVTLYDFYTKQIIAEYTSTWIHRELSEPMKNNILYRNSTGKGTYKTRNRRRQLL